MVVEADAGMLSNELSSGIEQDVALVIPLSRHKHILPTARWGHVTTDDRVLPWTNADAHRFRTLQWLKELGFNETSLSQPVPRFEQLTTLKPVLIQSVMLRWAELSAWRRDTTYLKVALIGARTPQALTS